MRKLLVLLLVGAATALQAQTMLPIKQNGKWGFINLEGKVVIEPMFDEAAVFKNGYAVMGINGKKGIIDSTGKTIIPAEYAGAEPMAQGFFALRKEKWSLADLDGKVYGDFSYDIIRFLDHKSIQLISSGKSYLFHVPTRQLSELYWDRVEVIQPGKWYNVWQKGKIGALDSLHRPFIQPQESEELIFDQGAFVAKTGVHCRFFDQKGEPVLHDHHWMYYKVLDPQVLVVYDKPSELVLLNLRDHKLILPDLYHQYRVLNEELIVCVKDHKEGLSNWNGDILVPNEYESISYYSGDGMLRMKKNTGMGIIDKHGKVIVPAEYSFIDPFDSYGRSVASKGGKLGMLSKTGAAIIPFEYDNLIIESDFIKGYIGQAMDVYTLNSRGLPEDKMHYNQVQTIQMSNRYRPQRPDYFNGTDFNYGASNSAGWGNRNQDDMVGSRFARSRKPVQYTSQSRIKCLINNNQQSVHQLFGIVETYRLADNSIRKRVIAQTEFWDIRVDELNTQKWARIIMPGGRQGMLSQRGAIKTQFPIKKGARTAPANIAYIGPYVNGLARINVGGALKEGASFHDYRYSMIGYGLDVYQGYWGFVNGDGEMQITAEYTDLSDFTEGRSIAAKEGKYGVIDTLNHTIIPFKYDKISYLPSTDNKYFRLERTEQRYGLIDEKGHVVLKAEYEFVGYPSEGLIAVKKNKVWGFTDLNGSLVIQPEFETATAFSEGLALVKKKNLVGYIDHSGKVVIDCKYGNGLDMTEGKIAVRSQGKWGYLDKSGKVVIPFQFSKASSFKNGLAIAGVKGKYGLIDASGKWLVHPAYDKVVLSEDGYYRLTKKGYCHLADAHGKMLHHVNYESVGVFHEGMAIVKEKGRFGYIDTTGKLVIPIRLLSARNFSEGLAAACEKYRTGYIDKTGTFVIEARFRVAEEFHEGIALVIEENNILAIDRQGTLLWTTGERVFSGYFSEGYVLIGKTYYNQSGQPLIKSVQRGTPFSDGLAVASFGGYDAIINPAGEHITEFQNILAFKNGYAPCAILYTYGIADLNGKIILEPNYQKIQMVMPGIFLIENFERIGYISSSGKWIWQPSK